MTALAMTALAMTACVMTVRAVRRVSRLTLALVVSVTPAHAHAQRQTPRGDASTTTEGVRAGVWLVGGDVGAIMGGTWLEGSRAPTLSGGVGVALSLDAKHSVSDRLDVGGAIRVAAQPLRLHEAQARWDGGTLTDAQILGTIAIARRHVGHLEADFTFGGGLALLTGARSLFPFSAAGPVTPVTEAGIVLRRGGRRDGGLTSRTLALFARYSVVRLDPGPTPAAAIDATSASVGWVARTTIGIRVQR